MEVVPPAEQALLTLDDQGGGAIEDEEAFLVRLAVVHRHHVTRLHDADVDAELRPMLATLEQAHGGASLAVEPHGVAGIEDEPVAAHRANVNRAGRQPRRSGRGR